MSVELTLRIMTEADTTVIRLIKDPAVPTSYKDYTCVVAYRGKEYRSIIPASELQDTLGLVRSARIPPIADCGCILSETSYELSIVDGLVQATYRWGVISDEDWGPLKEIAGALMRLGFEVSGHYMP